MKRSLLILLTFNLAFVSLAQRHTSTAQRQIEFDLKGLPADNAPSSPFYLVHLADSLSRRDDSLRASAAFNKVDPFYFLYLRQKPNTIDSFFSKFVLTDAARKTAREKFLETFNIAKSVSYTQFEKFWLEDKKLKHLKDQSSYDRLDSIYKVSEHADSVHSAFLRSYVKANGWPSFAEGGLYAMDLAVHDYLNYEFLFPILKDAYKAGKIPFSVLRLIHDYSPSLDFFYRHENELRYHHEMVDVSSLVDHVMPDEKTTQKILRIYTSHCPLKKIFLVYENSKVNNSYYLMPNKLLTFSDNEKLLMNRFIDLFQRIPNKICKTDIAPFSDWIISDTKNDKLKLYICY